MNDLLEQPSRVQRKRTKGFKLPPMTKCVTRGTPWGNPFYVGPAKTAGDPFACETNEIAVEKYTAHVQGDAVPLSVNPPVVTRVEPGVLL